MEKDWKKSRDQIVGLGETSLHKSYYPELQNKIESLENSYTNLQEIINSLGDAIILHDIDGIILSSNDHAKDLFEISDETCNKCSIYNLTYSDQADNYRKVLKNIIEKDVSELFEWVAQTKISKEKLILQVSINKTNWKEKPAFVAVLRDFKERKIFENALIEARKKAVESDRLKAAFLSNLSHEIRTPMNGIMGFLNLLKNDDIDDINRDMYIDLVLKSSQRMITTISDIVMISKIDSKTIPLTLERVDLKDLISNISLNFQNLINDKNLQFEMIDLLPKDIQNIRSDKHKLETIINNILNNAYKFTNAGKITLKVEIKNNNLHILIKDTGIGIPSDRHKHIFDPFIQADLEDRGAYEGSGLGLTISRSFIEMLKGEIKLVSEVNQGSCFFITLPIQFMDPDIKTIKDNSTRFRSNSPIKILIAEDDEISQIYMKEILEKMPFDLFWVNNGYDAIEYMKNNPDISLILMDIKMPGIDGLETCSEIRRFNTKVKIIAQTAYALPDDHSRCLKVGCNGYISKPIIAQELYDLIANTLKI